MIIRVISTGIRRAKCHGFITHRPGCHGLEALCSSFMTRIPIGVRVLPRAVLTVTRAVTSPTRKCQWILHMMMRHPSPTRSPSRPASLSSSCAQLEVQLEYIVLYVVLVVVAVYGKSCNFKSRLGSIHDDGPPGSSNSNYQVQVQVEPEVDDVVTVIHHCHWHWQCQWPSQRLNMYQTHTTTKHNTL